MDFNNTSYKHLHEQFVSEHTGTSALEVSWVMSVVVAVLLRSCLQRVCPGQGLWVVILRDHMCLIVPFQLALTLLNGYSYLIVFTITLFSLTLMCIKSDWERLLKFQDFLTQGTEGRLPYISYCRAFVLINTAISILAVDFTIFPRRFCKVETYGTSVMDAGVGLFILSNAIVSPEARGKHSNQGLFSILRSLKSCLPLLILGTARMIVTKGVDYQEHVTEYGVHWNFFFTLASVKILSTIIVLCFPEFSWKYCAIAIMLVHQYSLNSGLADYILRGADGQGGRKGIIDANREGIYSSPGYVVLYICGVEIGKILLRTERKIVKDWVSLLMTLVGMSMLSWLLFSFTVFGGSAVSRRFVNLSYVIWIVALSTQVSSILLAIDLVIRYFSFAGVSGIVIFPKYCLLESINYNGLLYFLLANVLTGLVNVSIQTLFTPPLWSFFIISIYAFSLSGISVWLYYRKCKLKFW